ncbi:hypothetical protein A33M_0091 [Rhodovulum sp. PH10]|nr:hypothetical protein A33M_0091 [Rhodovulum sp. PH10]
MRGLDPRIHPAQERLFFFRMGRRVEPGDDGGMRDIVGAPATRSPDGHSIT